MMPPKAMRHWRCRLGLQAWLLMAATVVFSAALTMLLVESVLERLVAGGGLWSVVPFAVATIVVVIGIFVLLRSGFGRGAIRGSWLGIPPTWLSAVFTVLIFWVGLWFIGAEPDPHIRPALASTFQRLQAVFTHGWGWLWGAVLSFGIASTLWQALLPRLLACYGRNLRMVGMDREFTPLPVDDISPRADAMRQQKQEVWDAIVQGPRAATDAASPPDAEPYRVPTQDSANPQHADRAKAASITPAPAQDGPGDAEIDHWLQGNEKPLQPGEQDLFGINPPPRRVLASLRPTHQYGDARTLALIGQRGGGKSSLLRLTAGLPEAKNEVELRFVYLSLWEYKNVQAAIRAAIKDVLYVIRDKIDMLPFTGAGAAFVRAIAGDGRFRPLAEALSLQNSSEVIFSALSTVLLFNKLRVIICIEDDDRITVPEQKRQFVDLITGSLDFIRRFPGFGYVICISSDDWSELQQAALNDIEPFEQQRKRMGDIKVTLAGKRTDGTTATCQEKNNNATSNHTIQDIQILKNAAAAAEKKQLHEFDTTRLCREELVIPPLAPEQWKPVLERVRRRMFDMVDAKASEKSFHMDPEHRRLVWDCFINKLVAPAYSFGCPYPEFRFTFTPRSLRRGLGDAWRKWLSITPKLNDGTILDPDSVLVACLVRACRPDVWNILIRKESLLLGGDWPVTNYLVQQTISKGYTSMMVAAHPFDKDQLGYGQAYPHLGLSQEIKNVTRKSCYVYDLSKAPAVPGTNVPGPVEEPFLPTAVRATPSPDVPRVDVVRPGGLIGVLPNDSNPGSNWRLFLNA